MFDRLIYENAVERRIESIVRINTDETTGWIIRRDAYLALAAIARASNLKNPGSWAEPHKPFPPALQLMVVAPPWRVGVEESAIQILVGSVPVADPACELPPIPGPNPPGIVDVGPHNWGPIWAVGPLDTMPGGAKVPYNVKGADGIVRGIELKRVTTWGFTGGRGYYEEVVTT